MSDSQRYAPTSPLVFLAALGPMLTVPAIRRLLEAAHHGPAAMHAFVAVGMLGAAVGAPFLGRAADESRSPLRIAAALAVVDALTTLLTSLSPPAIVLFVLRPVHGAASMGLLAVLLATLRAGARSGAAVVVRGGAPMVAALAIGPALGGALVRIDVALPFRVAACVAAAVSVVLAFSSRAALSAEPAPRTSPLVAIRQSCRGMRALLFVTALQRFAIGGMVVAFAVHARAVHRMSDAAVGGSFGLMLVVFALAMIPLGAVAPMDRRRVTAAGAALFGAAFVALPLSPRWGVSLALLVAGVGAAMVYAPTLALASMSAPSGSRATAMALLHAAGALGMVVGPAVAGLLDLALGAEPPAARAATFLVLAGVAQLAGAFVMIPRADFTLSRAQESASPTPNDDR